MGRENAKFWRYMARPFAIPPVSVPAMFKRVPPNELGVIAVLIVAVGLVGWFLFIDPAAPRF